MGQGRGRIHTRKYCHPSSCAGGIFLAGAIIIINGSTIFPAGEGGDTAEIPTAKEGESPLFVITVIAVPGGSVSPPGPVTVPASGNFTFTFLPSPSHRVQDIVIDGISSGSVAEYQFLNISSDHELSVSFTDTGSLVVATASAGGSINPSGEMGVRPGENISFTIVPEPGCSVADVLVDGLSAGPRTLITVNGDGKNRAIDTVFSCDRFFITATAGEGGTVTPNGTIAVPRGSAIMNSLSRRSRDSVSAMSGLTRHLQES